MRTACLAVSSMQWKGFMPFIRWPVYRWRAAAALWLALACITGTTHAVDLAPDIEFDNQYPELGGHLPPVPLSGNNAATVIQNGNNNRLIAYQLGGHNTLNAAQTGDSNIANLIQVGLHNNILLSQTGEANRADIAQGGLYNSAQVTQTGFNNLAQILQLGIGQSVAITQTGNSNTAKVIQH